MAGKAPKRKLNAEPSAKTERKLNAEPSAKTERKLNAKPKRKLNAKLSAKPKRKCGLCGNSKKKKTKTPCCNNWICDDEHTYVMFSYARNSCYRNHERYTLCSHHFTEEHQGSWKDCEKCKSDFDTPRYVTMGTKYNFEVLENPPKFSIACANCGVTADTLDAFPLHSSNGYYCAKKKCLDSALPQPAKKKCQKSASPQPH